ncbi:AcrR family transcriptional regulator [Microbacterium resistens]|uniref:AcrR family transcriptional regulator n=1 Tax=Microbacterium resistens TaxID=156977 RepID=A0ABU1SDS5_9MICO|nr:helix-turn-helix domain-containing protein [Microbacterium resistens]MDR6867764.1 AcrR family transcriptional regulator [Microbacterium resistens]
MHSAPDSPATDRGRAREARANDRAVLEAARDVFAAQGFDAPTAAIARRAGVGVATVYRRYRSKDELVHALRLLALEDVTRIAQDVAAERPPLAIGRFLVRHLQEAASPLATTFGRLLPSSPEIEAASDRLRDALDHLIALDRDRDLIPEDYTAGEVMLAIAHLRPHLMVPRERATELHLRQLDLYLAGLREVAQGRAKQRGAALTWDEWVSFNSAP